LRPITLTSPEKYTQYKRTVLLSQITKEIRKSLVLEDMCNSIASQLGLVLQADFCSVYYGEMESGSYSENGQEKLNRATDLPSTPNQNDFSNFSYMCMSQYEGTHGTNWPSRIGGDQQEQMPPLHLIPGYALSSME
jgi:hypothetical protein